MGCMPFSPPESGGATDEADKWKRAKGHEELSRAVSLAVEASHRPKPIHGAPLKSKFWVRDDSESEDDELAISMPETPSMQVFINEALQAGFTL